MKNLKKIPVKFSQAETTPDGINLVRITEAGWSVHVKLVGWKTIIRWLDEGHYDRDLADGMRLVVALWDGKARGYVRLTDEQEAVIWRWLVTCLFIGEQQEKKTALWKYRTMKAVQILRPSTAESMARYRFIRQACAFRWQLT
ncbi:TPA: hypothetical protein G9E90_001665 [Salmonella enterica]|nr:hypothetical protein [Salmonella enterica]